MQLDKYICTIDLINNIEFKPFEDWKKDDSLKWYQDYNKLKHNRTSEFSKANLYNVLISFSALRVLLFAQYGNFSLDNALTPLSTLQFTFEDQNEYDLNYLSQSIFKIIRPDEKYYNCRYNFNWEEIKVKKDIFERFDFN